MPFRLEQIRAICELTDKHLAQQPVTESEQQRISDRVHEIVKANELLAGEEFEMLSDTTATALLVLLISDVE